MKETGCVKWFNNKSGYGFISSCEKGGGDVFAHHSSLHVGDEQYRYLVAGEYVEYSKEPASNDHQWQATRVTGVKGGKLMCETRNEIRNSSQGSSQNKRRPRKSTKHDHDNASENTSENDKASTKEYLEVAQK